MTIRNHRRLSVPLAALGATLLLAGCASTPVESRTATTTPSVATAPARQSLQPVREIRSNLARQIDAYINQERYDGANWGIAVMALDTGRILYEHNADKLAIPASNTKIYSAALALSKLGANAHVRTSLYATAAPQGGTLHGNLVLYGRGDPSLGMSGLYHGTPDWADTLAKALAARGVKRVDGDLIADATYFAASAIPVGWEARDMQLSFAAPVSALSVDGGKFVLSVDPGKSGCCRVTTKPAIPGLDVVNLATLDASAGHYDLGVYRRPGANKVFVYGKIRPSSRTRRFELAIERPARLAGNQLRTALASQGIAVSGSVRVLHWPEQGTQLAAPGTWKVADVVSPSLSRLVWHTLKFSDNQFAEALFLQAGKRVVAGGHCADRSWNPSTTPAWALCGMRAMLRKAGVSRNEVDLEEGSGLSRKNIVTPMATAGLLAWIRQQPFASAFVNALPVAGKDGTLIHRMKGTSAAGNLRAKTGSIRHSYTLSGYVTAASGEPLVFSIMLDDYIRPTTLQGKRTGLSPQGAIDDIAQMLAAYDGHR